MWISDTERRIIEEFIEWADSTPAVTWSGRDGVKDRWRQLVDTPAPPV